MTSHPNVWLLFYELPSVCDLMSSLCGQIFSIPHSLGKVCLIHLSVFPPTNFFCPFIQGVYLTDMFAKLVLSSKATPGTKFALVCEADLGRVHQCDEQQGAIQMPAGFHSVKQQNAKRHPTESHCVFWKGKIMTYLTKK